MFRLTREVRFAINDLPGDQLKHPPSNGYGGYPALTGFGQFFALQVTLEGELDPTSCYLRNIKEIDQRVREHIGVIEGTRQLIVNGHSDLALKPALASMLFTLLRSNWDPDKLHSITLVLTPYLSVTQLASEHLMHTRLSQKFEFSAAHRLHNPKLSDDENRRTYGKCNNPHWHGHNYEVQVTLRGSASDSGLLINVPVFEKIVSEFAIQKLDHKNLNQEVAELKELIPTVETIARVIFQMLKSRFIGAGADLASVTVWETPKTWCEYSE